MKKINKNNNFKNPLKLKNGLAKNILTIVLVFVLMASVFAFFDETEKPLEISKGKLVEQINEGKVKKIDVKNSNVEIELLDGTKEKMLKDANSSLEEQLAVYGVGEDKIREANISTKGDTSV